MLKTAEGILLQKNREKGKKIYENMAEIPGPKKNTLAKQRIVGSIDLPERSSIIWLSKFCYKKL
jgi:hypothetical protein